MKSLIFHLHRLWDKQEEKAQLLTSGFTQAGVYVRRQFCGNLEVYRPQEHLCTPRLREAATTLYAIWRQRSVETKED